MIQVKVNTIQIRRYLVGVTIVAALTARGIKPPARGTDLCVLAAER